MTNTPEQALANAERQSRHGPQFRVNTCLAVVRQLYGVAARYPSASVGWRYAKQDDGGHPGEGHGSGTLGPSYPASGRLSLQATCWPLAGTAGHRAY